MVDKLRLNFHSYIQVISNFIPSDFSLDSFCCALFSNISYDKSLAFDSTYRNKMINGRRDVPSDINKALEKADGQANLKDFFEKVFLKDYEKRPELISLKSKIGKLIESCDEDDATKTALLNILYNDDLAYALSYIFIFASHQPNKKSDTTVSQENLQNIFDVGKKCPLCGKSLIVLENKREIYLFESTPIFPINIDSDIKNDFLNIHPAPKNKDEIVLCPKCAADYLFHPTVKSYDILWETNNLIKISNKIEKVKYQSHLETQLQELISQLSKIKLTTEEINELRLNPIELINKINNNPVLEFTIQGDLLYFPTIQKLLSDLDSEEANFEIIASEFKTIYKKLQALKINQITIYNTITKWILEKLSLSDQYAPSARLVVSFFVQDCEVFDEISK